MMLLVEAILVDKPEWGDFPLLLLERGVDPFLWDNPGGLFMDTLAFYQGTGTIKAMAEFVPRVEDSHFIAALKWANPGAIRALLQMGHDANAPLVVEGGTTVTPIMVVANSLYKGLIEWPQAREAFRELRSRGADMKVSVPTTGSTVLHDFFSSLAENDPEWPTRYRYDDVCQYLAFLIGEGADPRAVDRQDRTPTRAAWDSPLQQAGVLVWYRVLRMCNLDPADLDKDYDFRFDVVLAKCYFCLLDARSTAYDFLLCPWCHREAYVCDYERNTAVEYDGSKRDPELDVTPCCPTAVCRSHRYRSAAESTGGFLLPKRSGGVLRRVRKCAEPVCAICTAESSKWNARPHYTILLDSMEDLESDGDYWDDEDSDEEQEFHDSLEEV
ncbi:hypothetical protein BZA05DRAFT_244302 [Tricharina praecox]|uniref:uncharacterized protein n=1 Tax=Tricharina praecox TaxID=43433 RepID=UPI00221FB984|nr:uncharacterized protein BZA05DRAFT_244302 [Tricharina praecox]KAI5854546.1 hypothetical protein BZA05DRAFT_244302 [Tricharina praecox]